jgi:acetyltransferase-like isoleucine patch superfamily enzyme
MRLLLSKFVKVHPPDGLRESAIVSRLYKSCDSQRVARWCRRQALKYEGVFFSLTARTIMRERHGVVIGAYSYGPCFDPSSFGTGTTIGRYVSIAQRVVAYQANHPMDRLSTHGFFFNRDLGYVRETNVPFTSLTIEHDAWIGDSVIITPNCWRIGLGAVVGAGSIVTKDVPDFAVVAGNPARLIKWRFSPEMQECIRNSRWWELPLSECVRHIDFMSSPLGADACNHPLLRGRCGNASSAKTNGGNPVPAC